MTDSKKLVIKINYQNKQSKLEQAEIDTISYITEWNIKRIVGAVAALCLLIAMITYIWINSGKDVENNSAPAIISLPAEALTTQPQAGEAANKLDATKSANTLRQQTPAALTAVNTAKQVSAGDHRAASISAGKVVRGSLAKYIRRKEPYGKITLPLQISEHSKQTIYYFTELQDMAGRTIYHEWLYKGKSINKRPIKITQQSWRTSTHKTIRGTAPGDWTVRVMGENGEIMHQIDFKVVMPNNSLAQ